MTGQTRFCRVYVGEYFGIGKTYRNAIFHSFVVIAHEIRAIVEFDNGKVESFPIKDITFVDSKDEFEDYDIKTGKFSIVGNGE